jgi:predicted metal-dependent HD superfamily phosphohydrolase
MATLNSTEILPKHWENLLEPFNIEPTKIQTVFAELVAAYSSVDRFYHTLKHIQQVLETIAEIQKQTSQPTAQTINFPAIQLAAWFHDVIYEPHCKDNEEKSVVYAKDILTQFKLPVNTIQLVQDLILNTKNHQALPTDLHSHIFLDSDLAILGASQLDYQVYSKAIRQEYSWLNNQLYRCGRKQVLQQFLQRQRIYFTQYMFTKLETRARLNLQSELAHLS